MDKDNKLLAEKIEKFLTALTDCYKDEEQRELFNLTKLELKEENLTEDFTCIIIAIHTLYEKITGDDVDLIGFTHIINRLAFQFMMEKGELLDE